MKIVRRFVVIQGRTFTQYVDGKSKSVWDYVPDEETLEEVLKTIEQVRTFDGDKK